MEFNHINNCWDYLREAKDYDDLCKRTLDLPRWSGDWNITRNKYNECLVINTVWNDQYQNYEEQQEEFDIPWPIEQEENNMEFEESRCEKLKKALWNEGKDAIENFCDVTLSGYENDTAIDNLIDDAIDQMPDDVFDEYYKQYVKEEE